MPVSRDRLVVLESGLDLKRLGLGLGLEGSGLAWTWTWLLVDLLQVCHVTFDLDLDLEHILDAR